VPTVLRWGPYRAFFYSNEGGEPAHIHVRSGNKEAKYWLHDLTIASMWDSLPMNSVLLFAI
jgi:hypothetical protein